MGDIVDFSNSSMHHDLSIHLLRQIPDNHQCQCDNGLRVQLRKTPQQLSWTRTLIQLLLHQNQLCHHTHYVQVHPESEQEIPQLQHFRQRWCASTQSEDGWERVNLSGEFVDVEKKRGEVWFAVSEDAVDEVEAGMDAGHCGSDVHGNVSSQEGCEEGVRLAFAAGGV